MLESIAEQVVQANQAVPDWAGLIAQVIALLGALTALLHSNSKVLKAVEDNNALTTEAPKEVLEKLRGIEQRLDKNDAEAAEASKEIAERFDQQDRRFDRIDQTIAVIGMVLAASVIGVTGRIGHAIIEEMRNERQPNQH